ncbi:hypothetical protein [Lederbergia panacisoli]|uniref:hypothetical protein n=1 Tax=Lederbergia panacisoli TaxID=1255251 RepID=UPI00214CE383|nr:hypothetical protein [Lederbergia panacisoli]MCR2822924.1 hypothetical protein [Lederbergia panacisoli]
MQALIFLEDIGNVEGLKNSERHISYMNKSDSNRTSILFVMDINMKVWESVKEVWFILQTINKEQGVPK